MGYQNYPSLENIKEQYNIMALVGNGFDIQVLKKFNSPVTSSYVDFYYFLKMKNFDTSNLIFERMEVLKAKNLKNWSDVEQHISELEKSQQDSRDLKESLNHIQAEFSEFLNYVVHSNLLTELSQESQKNSWSKRSLSLFMQDLGTLEDLKKVPFGGKQSNYDLYNFYFLNFNYTSLLDNYLFLDSTQFELLPHKTVDTNFVFNTDPNKLTQAKGWDFNSSSYLVTQIEHPHGYQDIPRSLLFGTGYDGDPRNMRKEFSKPYRSQAELKFQPLFAETNLFIIFGLSLGQTDNWWWLNIYKALKDDRKKALIIYWWTAVPFPDFTENDVIEIFFDAANVLDSDRENIREQICVIIYSDDSARVWLSTE